MPRSNYVLNSEVPVEAFDLDWKSVGDFPSIKKAASRLYINSYSCIWKYLYHGNKVREKRGVKSKVTGKIYHFKLKQ